MRLLYITNQICGSGGLERVLSIKASYLADVLGYEVHLITLNQGKASLFYKFSEKLQYHDISVKGNALSYTYRYVSKINQSIKEIEPDIISVCDDGLKGMLLPLVVNKDIAKIYERHVSKNIEIKSETPTLFQRLKTRLVFSLMHYGAKKFDRFIVLTKGNAKEWKLSNIQVISNPLSFYPELPSNLEGKKVLAVGRHAFQKGYDRLLQSWSLVNNSGIGNWNLNVYGKIDNALGYIKQAQEMDIEDSVSFHNPVKNIEEKYLESSIYVMSSRYEGFGMVLIEAMAYGIPCISYDCPYGPSDIITDGKDGFLVPNGDIEVFSEKLILLMNNESLRKTMGEKARRKALNYSPDQIMPIWDNLFKNLVHVS